MTTPKAMIVYFSQGGTNARVADAIATGLRGAGYEVDLWNLRNGQPPDVRGYQLLGIGSPVYYFHLPLNVSHYVRRLPNLGGIPAFVFIVHGSHRIDTANWLRRTIERKGAQEIGYFIAEARRMFCHYCERAISSPPIALPHASYSKRRALAKRSPRVPREHPTFVPLSSPKHRWFIVLSGYSPAGG